MVFLLWTGVLDETRSWWQRDSGDESEKDHSLPGTLAASHSRDASQESYSGELLLGFVLFCFILNRVHRHYYQISKL